MFSVLILTLNEEKNLPSCLASLAGCDDVVVLDSGSTDHTADIARATGASIYVHAFENFATQRNHAHEHIVFKHAWVLHLDADETLTPELARACHEVARQDPSEIDGYLIAPQMIFRGRWIPHCTDFPAYQARFVHVQRFRFVQSGHGQREAPGLRLGKMNASYRHDLSAQTESEWKEKHRRYAHEEAAAFLAGNGVSRVSLLPLFSKDALIRRRALKAFSYRLPARGGLRFLYQYIWRRGFLDGSAGYRYCCLLAAYEGWISRELIQQRKALRS
jgi:glycosyltransferase involved in cell wall biosynthesis